MSRTSKRMAIGAGLVTVALAVSACGSNSGGSAQPSSSTEDAVPGGTLNMLGTGDVDYMDPNISYYSIGYQGLRMWSRQLFSYPAVDGSTTQSVPDLAAEVPSTSNGGLSADGLTYTIKLVQGAQWNTSPPRQVTAQDVVRGVKRTCNPVQPFGGIPDFATLITGYQTFCDGFAKVAQTPQAIADYVENTDLPGVKASDDATVVFTLTHPATYFVDMLTLPAFSPAPKEVLAYLPGSADLAQHQVSDGPYQVTSYEPTKSIVFDRNPAWQASSDPIRKAYVDKIVINETGNQQSIQQQLQTGTPSADMEFDSGPPPSQLPQLIASKDPNFNLGETDASNPTIIFNTVSPNNSGALGNVKVRQALEDAIDRDAIIQSLGGPDVNPPLTHVLPAGIVGSTNLDTGYTFDAAKAKQELADAGYPNGLTLKFLYRSASEGSTKTFATVQQELKDVGITVVGVPSPNADFYTKYLTVPTAAKTGVWDLSLAGWSPDWYGNAALSYFAPLYSGPPSYPPTGSNFGFYNSDATNALIQQAVAAATEDDAAALWSKADAQVMEDAPIFPITSPFNSNYHASQVHNAVYIPAIQNFDPTNVWLSKDMQGD